MLVAGAIATQGVVRGWFAAAAILTAICFPIGTWVTSRLMREPKGQDVADLVDQLSLHDDVRRQVVRVLGGMEATG